MAREMHIICRSAGTLTMQLDRLFMSNQKPRPYCLRQRHFILIFLCLIGANTAWAGETVAGQLAIRQFPLPQIFTFLFLMLGPLKIIAPFAKITEGADTALMRRIALRATLFSSLALLFAAILGERLLGTYGLPLPMLALAAGLILFLVALLQILHQFMPGAQHCEVPAGTAPAPDVNVALAPLAFPIIITPYGIATLVIFLAFSKDLRSQLIIAAIVLVIMLLNLFFMLVARHMLPFLGILLPILGAVLGVVQVALGLQIIIHSLNLLGVM